MAVECGDNNSNEVIYQVERLFYTDGSLIEGSRIYMSVREHERNIWEREDVRNALAKAKGGGVDIKILEKDEGIIPEFLTDCVVDAPIIEEPKTIVHKLLRRINSYVNFVTHEAFFISYPGKKDYVTTMLFNNSGEAFATFDQTAANVLNNSWGIAKEYVKKYFPETT